MTGENKAGDSRAEVKAKRDVQFWLDVLMKLTVPLGAIVAAWLANHFEQNRANLQLINQREQAESSLRATMFGQLIAPIAGPGGSEADSDPVRYAVLAQLLTLNFHEHFELRPLLQDADDRLSKYQGPVAPEAILTARSNLRQAAHRVIQRQIAQRCAALQVVGDERGIERAEGLRLDDPVRQRNAGHEDHHRRGSQHGIVHAGRVDERHWQPPALLPRRGSHRANARIADRLRGLAAARQLERKVRRRRQRRLGRDDFFRASCRPVEARLRDGIDQHRA